MDECLFDVFRVLINDVGPFEAIEAIKPISLSRVRNLAEYGKRIVGIQRSDLETLAFTYYVWIYVSSTGNLQLIQIRDGKAIVEVNDCSVTILDGALERCIAMSHLIS